MSQGVAAWLWSKVQSAGLVWLSGPLGSLTGRRGVSLHAMPCADHQGTAQSMVGEYFLPELAFLLLGSIFIHLCHLNFIFENF